MKFVQRDVADRNAGSRGGSGRPLLVVAHPGHELRLFGWLCATRAEVAVLTDGSGHVGRSRIDATRRLLQEVGAREAPIFGACTDRQIYRGLLEGDTELCVELARNLIDLLQLRQYHMVVADPLEGYNPVHDLCRVLVDLAVRRVGRMLGWRPRSYEYALTRMTNTAGKSSMTMRLPADVRRHKVAAATAYSQLFDEVEAAVRRDGERAYDEEVLREIDSDHPCSSPPELPPFYETYGEQQCAAGRYSKVIRHAEHFLPMIQAVAYLVDPCGESRVQEMARSGRDARSLSE